jgi:Uri superfamily endonuclease
MRLRRRTAVAVGRLGKIVFPAGGYAYVGSAHGRGGLAARLKHHLDSAPKPHWHIDYFKKRAPVVEIWAAEDDQRQECRWARTLHCMADVALPAPGFGASDCRCTSHLFRFSRIPCLADFNRRLEQAGGGIPARRIFTTPETKRGGTDESIDTAPRAEFPVFTRDD